MITTQQKLFCALVVAAALLVPAPWAAASETQATAPPVQAVEPVSVPMLPSAAVATPVAEINPAPGAKSVGRIGYVDIIRVADESETGKSMKARFKEQSNKVQSQLGTKQKQLEKQKSTLEQKLQTMIPDQRAAKIKEYEKKVEEFRAAVKKAEKDMQPLQEELTQTITRETVAACEDYGKKNGLAAISASKNLLFVGPEFETSDITAEIIRTMNEKK